MIERSLEAIAESDKGAEGGRVNIAKIIIVWLAIIIMGCFWLTTVPGSDLVEMAVLPGVPGKDKQIITTFKLNNPTSEATTVDYTLYADEELMLSGASTIAPQSRKKIPVCVISMFLIVLLIFLELSEPLMDERIHVVLGGLRVRFNTLTSILFIIFMGIVYTKIVIILAS